MRAPMDRTLFDEQVLRQIALIRRIGAKRLRNRDALDDFVQEALVRAYAEREALRDPARIPQWIAGIARNVANEWRRGTRVSYVASVPEPECAAASPLDAMERSERDKRLREAIAGLPTRERELVVSHYIEGVPYAELERREGVSHSLIGCRLFRARKRLKRALAGWAGAALGGFGLRRAFGGVLVMNTYAKVGIGVGVVALMIGVWQIAARDSGAFGFARSPKAENDAPEAARSASPSPETSASAESGLTSRSASESREAASAARGVPEAQSRTQTARSRDASEAANPADTVASGGAATVSDGALSRTPAQQKVYDGLRQIELQRRAIVQQMLQIANSGPQIPPRPSDDATPEEKAQWDAVAQPIFERKMSQVGPLIERIKQLGEQTEALVPSAFTRVAHEGPDGPGVVTQINPDRFRAAAGGSLPLEDMGLSPLRFALEGPNNIRIYISVGRIEDLIFGPGG